MLLAGIPRADAVALIEVDRIGPAASRRCAFCTGTGGWSPSAEFQPSQRLILEALRRKESVLHVWGAGARGQGRRSSRVSANVDWAFCTPVLGEACRGWGIYVAGQFAVDHSARGRVGSTRADLREDLKFTELVASTSELAAAGAVHAAAASHLAQLLFAPRCSKRLTAEDPDLVLAPRETEVSVLFCDLRGFSRETERNAGDLLALLGRVSKALGVMTHHILEQGGVFGDFQGDAAMGFWGWPLSQPDAIERACLAALAIRVEFEAAAKQQDHPLANFRMGIGLATGRAVAGRIGTVDQVKVTVFGPVVNLASRLEGMTKILQAPILLDEATARAVRDKCRATWPAAGGWRSSSPTGSTRPSKSASCCRPWTRTPN